MKISQMIDITTLDFEGEYANVTPSLIPNTTMKVRSVDGGVSIRSAWITPSSGYVLHDAEADNWDPDGNLVYAYSSGTCSCGGNYELSTETLNVPDINGNTVAVTAYGTRQFFAFPENLVPDPEVNIYGEDAEHEEM